MPRKSGNPVRPSADHKNICRLLALLAWVGLAPVHTDIRRLLTQLPFLGLTLANKDIWRLLIFPVHMGLTLAHKKIGRLLNFLVHSCPQEHLEAPRLPSPHRANSCPHRHLEAICLSIRLRVIPVYKDIWRLLIFPTIPRLLQEVRSFTIPTRKYENFTPSQCNFLTIKKL